MSLYRNYRPQTFADVSGQEYIIKTITNQIANSNHAHAYLFSGPRGTGKTTTARLVAKAINCSQKKSGEFEPCNSCSSCLSIIEGNSIDVIEIDAASHTGVDSVRENIIDNAQFKPTSSPFKIFIIDETHMLSTSAFNALLKTLEEPPTHIIFILATTEPRKLPDTIISRCQRFQFKKISNENTKEHLKSICKKEKVKIDEDVLDRVVTKSEGHLRDAVSLLEQLLSYGDKKIDASIADILLPSSNIEDYLDLLNSLIEKDQNQALNKLNKVLEDGIDLKTLATDLLNLLRTVLILKATGNWSITELILNENSKKILTTFSLKLKNSEIIQLADLIMKRKEEIPRSPIPQLPLEMFILEWCDNNEIVQNNQNQNTIIAEKKPEIQNPKPIAPEIIQENTITEIKNTPSETETIPVNSNLSLNLNDILSQWSSFLSKTEEKFPSLVFIFKTTNVIGFDNGVLKISVPYSFHKDKLLDKKCLPNVLSILKEIYKTKIQLDITVAENEAESENNEIPSEISDLANLVGGEVV